MDKDMTKTVLTARGIPNARWLAVRRETSCSLETPPKRTATLVLFIALTPHFSVLLQIQYTIPYTGDIRKVDDKANDNDLSFFQRAAGRPH